MEPTIIKRLKAIKKNNKINPSYLNTDLYRLLYKPDFYKIAYECIKSNKGSVNKISEYLKIPDIDTLTADGFSMNIISAIIEQIKSESFTFKPVKRVYIPKLNRNSKKKNQTN